MNICINGYINRLMFLPIYVISQPKTTNKLIYMFKYISSNIYNRMTQLLRFGSILFFTLVFSIFFVSAAPQLTIHSPEQTGYDSTKIFVNVTSSEPVDFFIKGPVGQRDVILKENSNNFQNYLYVNEGKHEFTIWVNNSNGETNAKILFNTTTHNPVNITSCGIFGSSDTEYFLNNDVGGEPVTACVYISNVRNISFDLNGHNINFSTGSYPEALRMFYVSNAQVFNGSINAPQTTGAAMELSISKTKFSNLNISGNVGVSIWDLQDVFFENVNMNVTTGLYYWSVSNIHFVNSTFTWNGYSSSGCAPIPSAFCDWSDHSEFFLEETNITGFPEYDFYLRGTFSDFYLRNTKLNMSKISYSESVADVRVFTQHLILIDVIDQLNLTGSGIIEVLDTEAVPRKEGYDALVETVVNPTSDLLVATNEDGTAEVWLTEKLTHAQSSSPAVVIDYEFSPYNLTAKTWDGETSTVLDLRNVNSTIPVSFQINVPLPLPACTISQMLDLNNDGNVTILDKNIVLDYINGKNVSINGTKQCKGINLFSL